MFTLIHQLIVILHMIAPVLITLIVVALAYLLIMACQWQADKERWNSKF